MPLLFVALDRWCDSTSEAQSGLCEVVSYRVSLVPVPGAARPSPVVCQGRVGWACVNGRVKADRWVSVVDVGCVRL
jgi:hypothetical protein